MNAKLSLFLLPLVSMALAQAQQVAGFGAVSGTLRDPYGDGLPDTSVVITNDTLGVKRTLMTTDDGMFLAAALPPGTGYNIKASRKGYGTWEYKDFDVTVGSTVSFAVTMQAETETTLIDNGAVFSAAVEDTKFNVSSFVSQRQLQNLPIEARRLEDPILLAPAVTQDPNTLALAFRGEGGTNAFVTDGQLTTNTFFYQTSRVAPQLTPDSLREMQVISSGASSEFGHAIGGTINAATPAGTADYHGALYGYFSTHSWDANDRFAPNFDLAQRWVQGGGRAGGPILAGKLFFFANFETWHGRSQGLNQLASPLLAGPQGDLLPSNCKATAVQCANAIAFLTPQLNAVVQRSNADYTGIIRLDYRKSDKNNFNLEFNAFHDRSPNGAQDQAVAPYSQLRADNGNSTQETRFARLGWSRTLGGTTANDFRIGWFKDRVGNSLNPALEPSTGPLAIQIAGTNVGANPLFPQTVSENRYQMVDNFTWASLSHLLKFGADVSLNRDWVDQLNNRYGSYTYTSLTAFATDFTNSGTARNYAVFNQSFPNAVTNLQSKVYSIYAQDDWRPTRRLNVMLGVRWEKYSVPQPSDVNATYYQTGSISSPSNAFAPRVGINYLLNDKTVVRVGVGFYYQPFTGELLRDLFTGNDVYNTTISVTPNMSGAPVFPRVIASATTTPNNSQNVLFANSKLKLPYAEVGQAGIERRVTSTVAVAVNYIESRGTKLWTQTDTTLAPPTITKTYNIDDAAGNVVNTFATNLWTTRTDTTHAHVWEIFNEGLSRYRAAALQVRKSMTHGISAQLSYTYSHARDDVSGPPAVSFVPATTIPGDYRFDYGNSNFDQRQRAVANFIWAPNPVKDDAPAHFLLNGWQLSGTFTGATGLPETATVMVNGQQFSGVTMLYATSLNGSGGWARVPYTSINQLRTGNQYILNARVTKMLPFTDRFKGSLMFEAFNALNRQFDTSLNTIEYVATTGTLRPVAGFGTPNAAYGYPFGTNARWCQVAFRVEF
ncbi:MAG TPA: TonB-dependent receptor [Bryobacteraceae bacterium]|nr:TonB-dependent receptor [Bryobacteraceae bacterium]